MLLPYVHHGTKLRAGCRTRCFAASAAQRCAAQRCVLCCCRRNAARRRRLLHRALCVLSSFALPLHTPCVCPSTTEMISRTAARGGEDADEPSILSSAAGWLLLAIALLRPAAAAALAAASSPARCWPPHRCDVMSCLVIAPLHRVGLTRCSGRAQETRGGLLPSQGATKLRRCLCVDPSPRTGHAPTMQGLTKRKSCWAGASNLRAACSAPLGRHWRSFTSRHFAARSPHIGRLLVPNPSLQFVLSPLVRSWTSSSATQQNSGACCLPKHEHGSSCALCVLWCMRC